jgi:hypothetical protein
MNVCSLSQEGEGAEVAGAVAVMVTTGEEGTMTIGVDTVKTGVEDITMKDALPTG